jgi:hypothetical protein
MLGKVLGGLFSILETGIVSVKGTIGLAVFIVSIVGLTASLLQLEINKKINRM